MWGKLLGHCITKFGNIYTSSSRVAVVDEEVSKSVVGGDIVVGVIGEEEEEGRQTGVQADHSPNHRQVRTLLPTRLNPTSQEYLTVASCPRLTMSTLPLAGGGSSSHIVSFQPQSASERE